MISDLAVLTPPLVVCVAVLVAIRAFLRHEMGPHTPGADEDLSADISAENPIPDAGITESAAPRDTGTVNDRPAETGHGGYQPRQ
ncbi:MAG: hypothetical protein ABSA03_07810 [Streptosporangiaceae bacterium]